jgi:hypothetical protein
MAGSWGVKKAPLGCSRVSSVIGAVCDRGRELTGLLAINSAKGMIGGCTDAHSLAIFVAISMQCGRLHSIRATAGVVAGVLLTSGMIRSSSEDPPPCI